VGEVARVGVIGGEPDEAPAGVTDQAGGDVQQAAQGVGGGLGQCRMVVEGE
jgi:hypothetical protein